MELHMEHSSKKWKFKETFIILPIYFKMVVGKQEYFYGHVQVL